MTTSDAKITTVSAIIPVYNGERYVGRAIESALKQSAPLAEIIVVDDGSTDSTLDVVSKYPVTVITQTNSGPGAARNAGARKAAGEWLAFLDHDDTWRPEKTERQLALADDTKVGVIYTPRRKRDEVPMTWDNLWAYNIVGTPTGVLVRRECLLDVGGFDTRRSLIGTEDYNLWMRIALRGWGFASCPGVLFDYTPAENSLSSQFRRMATAECISYEDIGKLGGFDANTILKRKVAVANHYIREFIGVRDRAAARQMILSTGVLRVSPALLFGAFCPASVLRIRKAIRASFSRKALSTG